MALKSVEHQQNLESIEAIFPKQFKNSETKNQFNEVKNEKNKIIE